MTKFILSIPDEINNRYFEDFILKNLNMEIHSVGCGTTEFYSDKKPRNFKERILKNFGTCTWNNIHFYEDEWNED